MALEDKIEAVKKVTEAMHDPKSRAEEIEKLAENVSREQFNSFLDANKSQLSLQKVDGVYVSTEGVQPVDPPPVNSENVVVEGNGSATDQEKKRQQHASDDGKIERVGQTEAKTGPSNLMETVKKLNTQVSKASRLSPDDLKHQAKDIIAQIDQVKAQLSNPSSEIKSSYQNVLHNRLTHIDDTLKIALSKAGVELPAQPPSTNTLNPIERFIGFLTQSQYQLEHLSQTIDQLNLTKAQLTPASMLALQIKVGYVQQQVELFTSLLNKALESTKTIMNVQV